MGSDIFEEFQNQRRSKKQGILRRDLLMTFEDYPQMHHAPKLKELRYKAIVLKLHDSGYGGHFPDLPGIWHDSLPPCAASYEFELPILESGIFQSPWLHFNGSLIESHMQGR